MLVGPMGAGKSTIGQQLANRLGYFFVDVDKCIEDRSGADIAWIFDVEGEQGFRKRETEMLEDIFAQQSQVIATGGGAVVKEENQHILQQGFVIYLKTTIESQLARTAKDKKRPLLQVDDPKSVLLELGKKRFPIYESIANLSICTDGCSVKQVVDQIMQSLDQS